MTRFQRKILNNENLTEENLHPKYFKLLLNQQSVLTKKQICVVTQAMFYSAVNMVDIDNHHTIDWLMEMSFLHLYAINNTHGNIITN